MYHCCRFLSIVVAENCVFLIAENCVVVIADHKVVNQMEIEAFEDDSEVIYSVNRFHRTVSFE